MQTIAVMEKTMCGHAPLRWNTGFGPGMGVVVPRVAFVVVRMGMQVEPVEGQTQSIRHAWTGARRLVPISGR
ncbi:hypothetical protein [Burkholderia cepacia]|uniref:hypothetical protein n=1 Tax=Burkholderia cepacia TaxID=292 RepID=UPI00232E0C23|nr:hypothetical protein [Burkholderia cepacia]